MLENSKSHVGADALVRPVERSSFRRPMQNSRFLARSRRASAAASARNHKELRISRTQSSGVTYGQIVGDSTDRCRATLDWAGEGTRPYVSIAWINIIAS